MTRIIIANLTIDLSHGKAHLKNMITQCLMYSATLTCLHTEYISLKLTKWPPVVWWTHQNNNNIIWLQWLQ